MAVMTNDLEDIPVTLDHRNDGVIVLSSDMILFSDALPRPDGKKIYHIFEGPVDNHEYLDEEKLQLFTKASADTIENIQKILESNGILFDEWCPPITPLQPSYSSQELHEKYSKGTKGRRWSSDQENRNNGLSKKTHDKTGIPRNKNKKKNGTSEVKKKLISKKENLPRVKFIKRMNKGNEVLKCCICSFSTNKKGAMKLHQLTHLGVKAISCSFCSFKTNYRTSLKGHLLSIHDLSAKKCLAEMAKVMGINGVLSYAEELKTRKKEIVKVVKNKKESGKKEIVSLKRKYETKTETFEKSGPMKEVNVKLQLMSVDIKSEDNHCTQNMLSKSSNTKENVRNNSKKKLVSMPENHKKYLKLAKPTITSKAKDQKGFAKCNKVKTDSRSFSEKRQLAGSKYIKTITPNQTTSLHRKRSISNKFSTLGKNSDFARNSMTRIRKSKYCKLKALRLRKREITKIENIQLLRCSDCSFRTRDKSELKRHIFREHGIYNCSKCSFSCCNTRELEVHKAIHVHVDYKCSKCSYSTCLKVRLKNHEASHEDLTEFRCEECVFSTNILEDLRRHSAKHKQRLLNCPECTFTCHSKEEMSQHDLNHIELRLFRCKSCGFSTNYEEELIDHNLSSHYKNKEGQRYYICSRCNYRSPFKATVRLHELTHSSAKLQKCPHCDYECRYKGNLDIHILTKHANKKIIYCEECTFTCSDEEEMSQHDLNHIDVGLFRCKTCNYATNIEEELEQHGKKHVIEIVSSGSENKVILKWDDSSTFKSENRSSSESETKSSFKRETRSNFKSETISSLKSETRSSSKSETRNSSNKSVKSECSRNGIRSYKCAHCDYTSLYKGNIKLHERNNHSENKKFRCPNCEYSTDFKNNMELHSVSHIEGKLLCFYCPFLARGKTELRAHILACRATHKKTKRTAAPHSFKCEDCNFITDSRGGYYQHRRTHSAVNKYKCPYCYHACTFKANLIAHIRCIHPGEDQNV